MPSSSRNSTAARANPRCRTTWGSVRVLSLALLLGTTAVPAAFAQVRINLAWDANTDDLTAGYRLVIRTAAGDWMGTVDVGRVARAVLPLTPGTDYLVAVSAYTAQGMEGPPSNEVALDLASPPGAPVNFGVNVIGDKAVLGWSPPAYRRIVAELHPLGRHCPRGVESLERLPPRRHAQRQRQLAPRDVTRSTASRQPGGRESAHRGCRLPDSNPSGPAAPSGLTNTWVGTNAQLSWTPSFSVSPVQVPSSYLLEAGTVAGAANIGSVPLGTATSYIVDVPAGTYYVRVRGMNAYGVSNPSNEMGAEGRSVPGAPVVSRSLAQVVWSTSSGVRRRAVDRQRPNVSKLAAVQG